MPEEVHDGKALLLVRDNKLRFGKRQREGMFAVYLCAGDANLAAGVYVDATVRFPRERAADGIRYADTERPA